MIIKKKHESDSRYKKQKQTNDDAYYYYYYYIYTYDECIRPYSLSCVSSSAVSLGLRGFFGTITEWFFHQKIVSSAGNCARRTGITQRRVTGTVTKSNRRSVSFRLVFFVLFCFSVRK